MKKWLRNSWDEVIIYIGTLAAVVVSPYLNAAASNAVLRLELTWGYVFLGAVISVALVAFFESRGFNADDDTETVRKKRDAKRRNIMGRLSGCMGLGFFWPAAITFLGNLVAPIAGK